MSQQQSKPNYHKKAHINCIKGITRASSSGDQSDYTPEAQGNPTTEGHPTKTGVKGDQSNMQKQTKESPKIGKQRNNLQSKGKGESPEKEKRRIEASNLSDIEFKVMVIRILKELRENYRNTMGATRN